MSVDLHDRASQCAYLWIIAALTSMRLSSVADGATVNTEANITLNQSSSDALQGRIGVLSAGASVGFGSLSGFTNASTATDPSDLQYLNPNSSVTVTYDLGEAGTATRELSSVSIWLHAGDGHRVDYAGGVAVSSDNVNFAEVASADRVEFTSGTPPQSHVSYSFAAGEVAGFRYLRIRDEAVFQDQGTTFGTGPYHPWIIEIDAFLVPPSRPGDYNQNGTVDAADYTVWRDTLGQTVTPLNDADGDGSGTIDGGDYDVWKLHFGETAGSGSAGASPSRAAVPEPATLVFVMAALFMCVLRRPESRR